MGLVFAKLIIKNLILLIPLILLDIICCYGVASITHDAASWIISKITKKGR